MSCGKEDHNKKPKQACSLGLKIGARITMDPKKDPELYIKSLEDRLKIRSDELEEIHMEAAIDAQLSATTRTELSHAKPIIANDIQESKNLFDDYVNPYSVTNCFSPYMPTIASKISSFVQFVGLTENDVLLDIGCGDGRVCIGASMISGCQSIGLDISPPCIAMAQEVAQEEGSSDRCYFFETDATIDPKSLLEGKEDKINCSG